MKSAEITNQQKKLLGVTTNDEIMPALEKALTAKATPPLGITIIISANGEMQVQSIGLSRHPALEELEIIQRALREAAGWFDSQKMECVRAEVKAQMASEQTPPSE